MTINTLHTNRQKALLAQVAAASVKKPSQASSAPHPHFPHLDSKKIQGNVGKSIHEALTRLLNFGTLRKEKSRQVEVPHIKMLGGLVTTRLKGSDGRSVYTTKITLVGKNSFNCSCPDMMFRRKRGDNQPCKHVLALALKARNRVEYFNDL